MTPSAQIRSPLPDVELATMRRAVANAQMVFMAYRNHGHLFEAAWSPAERQTFFRAIDARCRNTVPDDAVLIGTYNADTGWPQFQEDLREVICEWGI